MGVKTLKEVMESYNIDIDLAIKRLKARGITAKPTERMKDIKE